MLSPSGCRILASCPSAQSSTAETRITTVEVVVENNNNSGLATLRARQRQLDTRTSEIEGDPKGSREQPLSANEAAHESLPKLTWAAFGTES